MTRKDSKPKRKKRTGLLLLSGPALRDEMNRRALDDAKAAAYEECAKTCGEVANAGKHKPDCRLWKW